MLNVLSLLEDLIKENSHLMSKYKMEYGRYLDLLNNLLLIDNDKKYNKELDKISEVHKKYLSSFIKIERNIKIMDHLLKKDSLDKHDSKEVVKLKKEKKRKRKVLLNRDRELGNLNLKNKKMEEEIVELLFIGDPDDKNINFSKLSNFNLKILFNYLKNNKEFLLIDNLIREYSDRVGITLSDIKILLNLSIDFIYLQAKESQNYQFGINNLLKLIIYKSIYLNKDIEDKLREKIDVFWEYGVVNLKDKYFSDYILNVAKLIILLDIEVSDDKKAVINKLEAKNINPDYLLEYVFILYYFSNFEIGDKLEVLLEKKDKIVKIDDRESEIEKFVEREMTISKNKDLNRKLINNYKEYLIENKLNIDPVKTIHSLYEDTNICPNEKGALKLTNSYTLTYRDGNILGYRFVKKLKKCEECGLYFLEENAIKEIKEKEIRKNKSLNISNHYKKKIQRQKEIESIPEYVFEDGRYR